MKFDSSTDLSRINCETFPSGSIILLPDYACKFRAITGLNLPSLGWVSILVISGSASVAESDPEDSQA